MQYMALIACKLFNSHTHSALSISFQTLYLYDQNQVHNWNAAFIISYVTWTLNMLWFMKLLQSSFFFNLVSVSLKNHIFSYEVPPISSYLAFIIFSPGVQSDPGTDWLAHCSHTWARNIILTGKKCGFDGKEI